MEILYGKHNLKEYMLSQINELFMTNYQCYHYKELTSRKGIDELLLKKDFDCVTVVEGDKIVGFAGVYKINDSTESIIEYKLAHLLVDTDFRGNGIGSMLEEGRLHLIETNDMTKIVYASCVETPKNSIYMKLKRNFCINGFRYKYRKSIQTRENAVVLVNASLAGEVKPIRINVKNNMTRKLLKKGNPDIIFTSNLESESLYVLDIYKDEKQERVLVKLQCNQRLGCKISDILLPKASQGEYVCILVSPSIPGYDRIDDYLVMNSFYPICYIPYAKDFYGIVEYQYLPNGLNEILQDDGVSDEGKNFIMDLCK